MALRKEGRLLAVLGGILGLIFAGCVPLASQNPYPIIVHFVANYRPQICNFRDPNLVTFYLCFYLILNEEYFTLHTQYKYFGTFANPKYEELSNPPKTENVQPHSSNSIKKRDPIQGHIPIILL